MSNYKLPNEVVERMKQMRYVEKRTLQEIADEFGISRQRVFQIVGRSGQIAEVYGKYLVKVKGVEDGD